MKPAYSRECLTPPNPSKHRKAEPCQELVVSEVSASTTGRDRKGEAQGKEKHTSAKMVRLGVFVLTIVIFMNEYFANCSSEKRTTLQICLRFTLPLHLSSLRACFAFYLGVFRGFPITLKLLIPSCPTFFFYSLISLRPLRSFFPPLRDVA